MGKVLDVISSSDTEATDKVLGSCLHISVAIVGRRKLIFGPAEVGIAGDGLGTVKVLKPLFGLGLSVGVKALTAKELVGGDTLLGAELGPGLGKFLL